ncbi:MAG: hypothetical protein GVY23_02555, partial [Spirochaetes bacterium]|nr:hypothetical protein [Spirochaetota bacterium]
MDSSGVAPAFTGTGDIHKFIETRDEPAWMLDIRRAALDNFSRMEWPTPQDEEWRRSDIGNYDFDSYEFAGALHAEAPAGDLPDGVAGRIEFDGPSCTGLALSGELSRRGVVFDSLEHLLRRVRAGEEVSEAAIDAVKRLIGGSAAWDENRTFPFHYSAWTHGV